VNPQPDGLIVAEGVMVLTGKALQTALKACQGSNPLRAALRRLELGLFSDDEPN
jgi:hypothetical protein